MKFIKLSDTFGFFYGGKKRYTKMPVPPANTKIIDGQPAYLNPDTWDAYNIMMTTPQLYAVISRKGSLMANGQWKHYKVGKDGNPELIENSDVVKFLENPNPLMNGNDYIKALNESKCVWGNSYEYILKGFNSQEIPTALNILPANNVEPKYSGKWYKQSKMEEIIEHYKYDSGGSSDIIPTEEIVHLRIANSDNPLIGESPLKSLYMPITNIRSAYDFRNVIMTKRGALGILSPNGADSIGSQILDDEERQKYHDAYIKAFGNDSDQMQTMITNQGMSYTPMSFPTQDLMLFEEVDENFKIIIDTFGLNDNLFSKSKGSTFENQAEGIKQAYQSTIIPEAEELAMNRSKLFGLIEKGEFLALDYSHVEVLQENQKEKAEVLERKANTVLKLKESGMFSDEEIKDILKFDE